jgi:pyruvate dehydrogenase E2 component (dihydrolipoamide acetyltransferase)
MPRLGMTMEEGTIVAWPVAPGASVRKGEIVLVIESEKAETEIEAIEDGILRHLFAEVGETLPCGALLAVLTGTADESFDPSEFARSYRPPPGWEQEGVGDVGKKSGATPELREPVVSSEPRSARRPVAPAARALARRLGLDLEAIAGSGPKGRVTTRDVEAFASLRDRLVPVEAGVALEVLREGPISGALSASPEGSGEGEAVDKKPEPVVLLPGFGTDVSSFALQISVLAEDFEVLGIHPRGVAGSDAPPGEIYEVGRAAEDVAGIVAGGFHVVGASLGAAVAIELALRHPDRLRSLTLITPFTEANARLRAFLGAWTRIAAHADSETVASFLLPWLFGEGLLADEVARGRVLRGLSQSVKRVGRDGLEPTAAGLLAWSGSRSGELGKIRVPTLVLGGGADLLTPAAEAVAAAIPDASYEIIEGCGHGLTIDAADTVSRLLLAHLGRRV